MGLDRLGRDDERFGDGTVCAPVAIRVRTSRSRVLSRDSASSTDHRAIIRWDTAVVYVAVTLAGVLLAAIGVARRVP